MIDLIIQLIIANKEAIGTFVVTGLITLLKRFFDIKKIKSKLSAKGLEQEFIDKIV